MTFKFCDRVKMAGEPIYTPERGPRHGVVVYNAGKLDAVNVRVRWSNGSVSIQHADDLDLLTSDERAKWSAGVPVLFNRSGGDSYDASRGADVAAS